MDRCQYCSTIARALALVLPPGAARRLSGRKRRAVARPVHLPVGTRGRGAPELTLKQQAVLAPVYEALRERRAEQCLLHGVTGSGKTEIYLCAANAALQQGRGAIVLVPEIALTPQIVGRFVERFGDTVAVLHSRLTQAQRYAEWRRLREGRARVCVGPRSAVFAPIEESAAACAFCSALPGYRGHSAAVSCHGSRRILPQDWHSSRCRQRHAISSSLQRDPHWHGESLGVRGPVDQRGTCALPRLPLHQCRVSFGAGARLTGSGSAAAAARTSADLDGCESQYSRERR